MLKNKHEEKHDGEYLGNIWGWKISYVGLVLILLFLALIAYRHITMDVPLGMDDPTAEPTESTQ